MTEPAWMALADGIWEWGLVPLRAHKTESKNNPDKPGILVTRHCKGLVGAELIDYRRVCTTIHEHAVQAGIDLGELVLDIARAMERGAHKAAAANAKRVGRLTPEQRRQYRRNSAAARGLAQWLSKEIRERPIPTGPSDGVITYTFTEGSDRNPTALADILIQRRFVKVDATEAGATVHCEGGPNSVAPAMHRVADAINGLHWIADLLRADVDRARPQGAASAKWKPTALELRSLFQAKFGEPLLSAVGVLAGLAHQCEVPSAELSRLSKP